MTDRISPNPPEMLPCPFCGGGVVIRGKALDERFGYITSSTVTCRSCHASISRQDGTNSNGWAIDATALPKAIAAWNTRASSCVKPLVWTEPTPPNAECSYDHVFALSALGQYSIEWKSWKDTDTHHDARCVFCANGDFLDGGTLDQAKSAAQAHYEACIMSALQPLPAPPKEVD